MKIIDFTKQHIAEAATLVLAAYEEERRCVESLPAIQTTMDLTEFAENGLGVAAFEENEMVGFLCCCSPFACAFGSTDVKGVFSPMGANAAVSKNCQKIYAAMYQAAAMKWVKAGAVSHAICLYAHDEDAQQQFYRYGFGLRCVDAIRPMDLIDCKYCANYTYFELKIDDYHLIYPFKMELNSHFCQSPSFVKQKIKTKKEFLASAMDGETRYFAAKLNDDICACLSISDEGETFVTGGKEYCHINMAYCRPEHRGKGVYQNLLNFVIARLKAEGYTRLGVDFESLNPTAYGFWLKYFTAYTSGIVRRIDERILDFE